MSITRSDCLDLTKTNSLTIEDIRNVILRCYHCGNKLKLHNSREYCPNCFKTIVLLESK